MIEKIGGTTVALVRLALDAGNLRHKVIAHNIANSSVIGYVPKRVSFEKQLAETRLQILDGAPLNSLQWSGVKPTIMDSVEDDRNASVKVDVEMAALAENTLHYHALAKALSKHLSIVSAAVNEGKR